MKTLQAREKKLLWILGGALLLGLHLILLQFALRFDRANRVRLAEGKAQLEEAQSWLQAKEIWEARAAWLEKHLVPVPAEAPEGALQKFAQASAGKANLTIEGQNLRALRQETRVVSVGNRMQLKGNLDQVIRWLGAVYDPDKGIAVTELSLRLSPEPPKMMIQAEIAQFFKKGNP